MKKIKKIKSGFISRQLGVAKLAIKTGKKLYENKDLDIKSQLQKGIGEYASDIADELDVMKGSFMKAGQMLSLLGSSFLPKEAQQILKKLENNTSYLSWDQVKEQIPKEWQEQLSIEQTPLAAASLGQVHPAVYKEQKLVVKIQYKGVKKAIKNDIKALKFLLKTLNLIPSEINLTDVFEEIEQMLKQEVDYKYEVSRTLQFKEYLEKYPIYKVPDILESFSNEYVITSEYLDGYSIHEIDNLELTQEQRNKLGQELMRLLFLEIFIFEEIQSDSHFGNYILMTQPQIKWGLIDFGATKKPSSKFIKSYKELIIALSRKDRAQFIKLLKEMGYLSKTKESNLDLFWEYALIIGSPFYTDDYDWGTSDISEKIYEYIPKIAKTIAVGNPPSESLFIDKKIAGVYFILKKLKSQFNLTQVMNEVLEEDPSNVN